MSYSTGPDWDLPKTSHATWDAIKAQKYVCDSRKYVIYTFLRNSVLKN